MQKNIYLPSCLLLLFVFSQCTKKNNNNNTPINNSFTVNIQIAPNTRLVELVKDSFTINIKSTNTYIYSLTANKTLYDTNNQQVNMTDSLKNISYTTFKLYYTPAIGDGSANGNATSFQFFITNQLGVTQTVSLSLPIYNFFTATITPTSTKSSPVDLFLSKADSFKLNITQPPTKNYSYIVTMLSNDSIYYNSKQYRQNDTIQILNQPSSFYSYKFLYTPVNAANISNVGSFVLQIDTLNAPVGGSSKITNDTAYFVTNNLTLLTPTSNSMNQFVQPTFSWSLSSLKPIPITGTSYTVYIGTSPGNYGRYSTFSNTTQYNSPRFILQNNTKYYWYVALIDANYSPLVTSNVDSFTTGGMSLPISAGQLSSVTLNNNIYYCGGKLNGDAGIPVSNDQIYIYNTTNSSWSQTTIPGGARYGVSMAAVGNNIYIIGGIDNGRNRISRVDILNTTNNSWTMGTPLPNPRGYMGVASVGSKIYCFGGYNSLTTPLGISEVDSYDTTTNSWNSNITTIPSGTRWMMGVSAIGNQIYLVGGLFNDASGSIGNTARVDILNVSNNTYTWSTGANAPINLFSNQTTVINNNIYTGYAQSDMSYTFGYFYIYNTTNNTWTQSWTTSSALYRGINDYSASIISVNNNIYIAGGFSGGPSGLPANNTFQIFNTATNLWEY